MIRRTKMTNGNYINGLRELRCLIDSPEFRNGGWLFSEREMCARCNISNITYRKALKHIQAEGLVVAYPRKGCYVYPQGLRMNKIGIVINDGELSPYWVGCSDLLLPLMQQITEKGYAIHQLQAPTPQGIVESAVLNGVNGAIWCNPSSSALACAKERTKGESPQILLVRFHDPASPEDTSVGDVPIAEMDLMALGKLWAEYLCLRNHHKIFYVGSSWSAKTLGLASAFRKAGLTFSDEYCFYGTSEEIIEVLPGRLKKLNITAVISEGAGVDAEATFKVLSGIPRKSQPELVCRYHGFLSSLALKYPDVKLVAFARTDYTKLAKAAANAMASHIRENAPLLSFKISGYSIEELARL